MGKVVDAIASIPENIVGGLTSGDPLRTVTSLGEIALLATGVGAVADVGIDGALDAGLSAGLDAGTAAGVDTIATTGLDSAATIGLDAGGDAAISLGSDAAASIGADATGIGLDASTAAADNIINSGISGALASTNAGLDSATAADSLSALGTGTANSGTAIGNWIGANINQTAGDAYNYVAAVPHQISSGIEDALGLPSGTLGEVKSGASMAANLLGLGTAQPQQGSAGSMNTINLGGPPAINTDIAPKANMSGLFNSSPTGKAYASAGYAAAPQTDPSTGLTGIQIGPAGNNSEFNIEGKTSNETGDNNNKANNDSVNNNANSGKMQNFSLDPNVVNAALTSKPLDFGLLANMPFTGSANSTNSSNLSKDNAQQDENPIMAEASKF